MIGIIPYQLSLLLGVLAFIYSNVLTQPDQLFASVYKKLNFYFKTDERKRAGKNKHPLFMILIHCEKCVAGQLALWLYIYKFHTNYDFIQHILFIGFTIFIAHTLRELNQKLFN